MAIQNKSETEARVLSEKAQQIQQARRHTHPTEAPVISTVAHTDNHAVMPAVAESAQSSGLPETGVLARISHRYRLMKQPGISLRQRIRLVPGIGLAISWCNAFLRLSGTRRQLALAQDRLSQAETLLHRYEQLLLELESRQIISFVDGINTLDIGRRLMELDRLHIARQLKSVNLMLRSSLQNEDVFNARLAALQPVLKQASVSANSTVSADNPPQHVAPVQTSTFNHDQFYLEFEALFRGSREDIKQRLKAYLPHLSHILSVPEQDRKPVIDVGCGRGEWLELMDEQHIPAIGVDMNASMVNACIEKGFICRHADAIAYLREQAPGSIAAVTGFQIIEHLPFEQLIALFDAALHALCPGGVIIFETPNPENLKVGSCNFYYDPTHLHPIVPQVAEFIARQRGFAHAEIMRLHPYPDDHLLQGDSATEKLLNKELFGPQDYAVIGKK